MTKILIVEDEPAMRANLFDVLELEGYQPLAAANGTEGVELARREKPDLILCDVLMPDMDGYAVLAALRGDADTANLPFIFLTAKAEHSDVRAGMNLGADDYLVKPVPLEELLAAIRARLERRRQQVEFKVQFKSPKPLEDLGLSPREAEILFWVAQGKTNAEIGLILHISPATAKKHLEHIFDKLGTENRATASLRAIEVLNSASPPAQSE
jgi:DNA-binding NarL/FixJ family response regulator